MQEVYHPPKHLADAAHISGFDHYKRLYQESIENPDKFWDQVSLQIDFWKSCQCSTCIIHMQGNIFHIIRIEFI